MAPRPDRPTGARTRHGTTVLWTSHQLEELERNCEQVLVLRGGRLVAYASPQSLVASYGSTVVVLTVARTEDTERGADRRAADGPGCCPEPAPVGRTSPAWRPPPRSPPS